MVNFKSSLWNLYKCRLDTWEIQIWFVSEIMNGVSIIFSFGTWLQKIFGDDTEKEEKVYSEYAGSHYVGTVCKILDYENKQYFLGKIEAYDIKYNEFQIAPYRMESIPRTVPYNTPVKLQIQSGEHLTMLYGTARKQDRDYWWVTLDTVQSCEEQREGFRQVLRGKSIITRPDKNESEKVFCDLVDISLTGICIKCAEDLEVGERIVLHDVTLYAGVEDKHTLVCQVRRVFARGPKNEVIPLAPLPTSPEFDSQEPQIVIESLDQKEPIQPEMFKEKYYGCSFLTFSQEEREQICRELFVIQQREREKI